MKAIERGVTEIVTEREGTKEVGGVNERRDVTKAMENL
jgi:hypothetical protein